MIYYCGIGKERCYLVYAYAKNRAADLTQEQLHRLVSVIDAEVRDE